MYPFLFKFPQQGGWVGSDFSTSSLTLVIVCLYETIFLPTVLHSRVCWAQVQILPAVGCQASGLSVSFSRK